MINIRKVFLDMPVGNQLAVVVERDEEWPAEQIVILLPGFLDSKDYAHLVELSRFLQLYRCLVARFDPSGIWESGEIGLYSVSQYLEDLRVVVEYALGEVVEDEQQLLQTDTYNQAESMPITLVGHSLGGMVAMLYAARDDRVSKVVNIMGPGTIDRPESQHKLERWEQRGERLSRRDLPDNPEQYREFTVPVEYLKEALHHDARGVLDKVRAELLFLTGDQDTVVLPNRLEELYELAHEPKKLVTLPGVGHDYRKYPEQIETVNRVVAEFVKPE